MSHVNAIEVNIAKEDVDGVYLSFKRIMHQ